jgi:NADH dehydrogenase (ubiquinone) 1 alpha subcomplex subunit 10
MMAVRGLKVKEFKAENPWNPMKPWPYETKDYKWYHSVLNLDRTVNRMDENSKVIIIEGNIGAGKSTLAKNLADMLGMKYYPEANFSDYYMFLRGLDLRDYKDQLGPTAQHFGVDDFYKDPFHPLVARFQVTKYMARHFQYCQALLHLFSTGIIRF